MSFSLGQRSENELIGVHPLLIHMVRRAILKSDVDFSVLEGVRSLKTQREYLETGVSRTMDSSHLVQGTGYGHAVDLPPWIGGRSRWEIEPCLRVAEAVREASWELGVPIIWGGVWRRLDHVVTPLREALDAYRADRGPEAFVDAVHYEMDIR